MIASIAGWETIPFHFVWVSLTVVYGVRLWRLSTTMAVLGFVILLTGLALLRAVVQPGGPGLDEMTEVPLMAAMFLAMVWYAERAKRAMSSEHRLLQREREFVHDASHELKTPITVARGHAELIRASATSTQIADDADVVLDELTRLSRVSERLLILAASEHPDFLLVDEVRVEPFLDRAVRRWYPTASRQWSVRSMAQGWVLADQDRLELALDSLIENAVKFSSDGDAVSVVAYPEGESLAIEVADTGVGIPPERLPGVFERFSRVDDDRGRGNGGTGLGLAIVRAIAEAHGGTVKVSSQRGRGTTFTIRLPGFRPARISPVAPPEEPAVLRTA